MNQYCSRCIYYLHHSKAIAEANADFGDTGLDVCRATLEPYRDVTGKHCLRTYGGQETCGECGTVLRDERMIKYSKASKKNRDFRCKDFTPKLLWWLPFFIQSLFPRKR